MNKKHPILIGFLVVSLVAVVFYFMILGSFSLMGGDGGGMLWLGDTIGVVEIYGVIDKHKHIVQTVREYTEDDSISAILVHIDSPGGVVAPTQEIYSALRKAAAVKPVFAAMGSQAASGGYYVACAAETIVANPGTLTGSLGVVMEFFSVKDAMDKFGVDAETITSGKHKSAGNFTQKLSRDNRHMLQGVVDSVHGQFVEVVMINRRMAKEQVMDLADGRVFTGAQALELGLVDQLGTFYDAVDLLKQRLGIEGKVQLVYPKNKKQSMLDTILDGLASRIENSMTERSLQLPFGQLVFR